MSEYKWYFILDGGAARTLQQWNNLRNAMAGKPFWTRLNQAGENANQPQCYLNINRRALDNRYWLGDVEITDADGSVIAAWINNQLSLLGLPLVGTMGDRAAALLLAEMREAGLELGFSALVVASFNVVTIGDGVRDTAISEAQAWLLARLANWGDT